jgi:hypothetical protein
MKHFVSLISEQNDVSREEFRVRLNEIYRALPLNVGDGFFKWWCDTIRKKAPKFEGVTPAILLSWLAGKQVPHEARRQEYLSIAQDVVKSIEMNSEEFFHHVRYCKNYLDAYFQNKEITVIAWANDFFFNYISLMSVASSEDAQAWFDGRKDAWMFVPRISLRMMTIRVVAEAVQEAIARDTYDMHQNYEHFDDEHDLQLDLGLTATS